jgi:hypothetical protein
MEINFYQAVKIAAVAYILYRVWLMLFRKRLFGLWDALFGKSRRLAVPKEIRPAAVQPPVSVIGRVNHVILEDPLKARYKPQPVATVDLEPTGWIGQQEPVSADEIGIPKPPYIPSEEELDFPPPDDNENGISSGVTFEDLSNAVEVLRTGVQDEGRRLCAAETVYKIQDTELEEFLTNEVADIETVHKLLKECLDENGFPLKKNNDPLAYFNIEDYV